MSTAGYPADAITRDATWGGFRAGWQSRRMSAVSEAAFETPIHLLYLVLSGDLRVSESSLDGHFTLVSDANGELLIPQSDGFRRSDRPMEPLRVECLTLQFNDEAVQSLVPELGRVPALIPQPHIEDYVLLSLGRELASEVWQGGEVYGRSFSEGLLTAISVHLIRRYSGATPQVLRPPCGGMPEHRLRRVKEYIEANLGQDVSISVLAQVAGLSPYHFCRLFRQSTGQSAHQYFLQRRIELAKRLCRDPELGLAGIAYTCGFSHQTHLTTVFKRHTGATPGEWRKQLLGVDRNGHAERTYQSLSGHAGLVVKRAFLTIGQESTERP